MGFLVLAVAQDVKLKWPNDVVLQTGATYRKLSGISLEGTADGLCLGIGVNVVPPPAPRQVKRPISQSLRAWGVSVGRKGERCALDGTGGHL